MNVRIFIWVLGQVVSVVVGAMIAGMYHSAPAGLAVGYGLSVLVDIRDEVSK